MTPLLRREFVFSVSLTKGQVSHSDAFYKKHACVIPRLAKRAEGPHSRSIRSPKKRYARLGAKRAERMLSKLVCVPV
jgi:hypothetical protein